MKEFKITDGDCILSTEIDREKAINTAKQLIKEGRADSLFIVKINKIIEVNKKQVIYL